MGGMIDDQTLDALRTLYAGLQDGNASVTRTLPATSSPTGGIVEQSAPVYASVACRFTFKSVPGPDLANPGKFVWVVQWILTFPYGTDVRAGDIVTDLASGRIFRVQDLISPRTIELTTRVVAMEVR